MRQPNSSKIPSEWSDLSKWPGPREQDVPVAKRARFRAFKRAIILHHLGWIYRKIESRLGRKESDVRRMRARCLIPRGKSIVGWHACVLDFAADLPVTSSENDSVTEKSIQIGSAGNRGRFKRLMAAHPVTEKKVRNKVLKTGEKFHEARIPLRAVHKVFLDSLREEGLTDEDYPFALDDQGYSSLVRYIKTMELTDTEKYMLARYGESASRRAQNQPQARPPFPPLRPLSEFGLDFEPIDAQTMVTYKNKHGVLIDVPVGRWNIGVLFEKSMRAVYGADCNFEKSPSADALSELGYSSLYPPEEGEVIEGDIAVRGGVLFGAKVTALKGNAMSVIRLDRGASNRDEIAATTLARCTGAMLLYAPSGKYESRPDDEREIGTITRRGIQRVAATLGKGPGDSRRSDPVGTALREKFSVRDAMKIFSDELEKINDFGLSATDYKSPVEIATNLLSDKKSGVFSLPIPIPVDQRWKVFGHTVRVWVCGNKEKGERPYVEYLGRRYRSAALGKEWDLIDHQVDLCVNGRCPLMAEIIRVDNGRCLGKVSASRSAKDDGRSIHLWRLANRGTKRNGTRAYTNAPDSVQEYYDEKNRRSGPGESAPASEPADEKVEITLDETEQDEPTPAEVRAALHKRQMEARAKPYGADAQSNTDDPSEAADRNAKAEGSQIDARVGESRDAVDSEDVLRVVPARAGPRKALSDEDRAKIEEIERRMEAAKQPAAQRVFRLVKGAH
ncbi:hypothetical protein [Paraburkholderia caribensis]|uniref:hypothetical protein n=1 Tax=Paraburkholderia caribensis TaxID=75105 RepID=UPI00078B59F8|nr:hypothetical protein [Paraburkholderia caribensis]AMV47770.1 hypothetical protein ATN79_44700 [Paraburkholderia caribensis]